MTVLLDVSTLSSLDLTVDLLRFTTISVVVVVEDPGPGGIRLDFHRRQFARAGDVAITARQGQSRPARLLHFHLRFHW